MVSSATTASSDAFNFLSAGAGKFVFEIFLNLYIGLLFVVLVCSLGNRPQVSNLNQLKTIDSTELTLAFTKGFEMDIHNLDVPFRFM